MASFTPTTQIASGHDNAGGLTLITSLTDSNSVPFVMPRALPNHTRGQRRVGVDGAITRIGKPSFTMVSSVMTILQYQYVLTNLEGLITIRLPVTGVTYANYNATLWMPDESELTYVYLTGSSYAPNFTGPGYRDVVWNVIRMEAL